MVHHCNYLLCSFDLDRGGGGVKVIQNVAQYLLHHATYAPTKFEIAMSNRLGGDAFTRKFMIWPWTWGQSHKKCCLVPSTLCDLCTYKVWNCYVQQIRRRCTYKKRLYLTLTLGSRSQKMLPSTLHIMWPMHLQSLKLLHPRLKRKYIIWPWPWYQGHTKCYPLHHVTYAPAKFEVAMSNSLGRDEFTREYLIWPLTLTLLTVKCCPVPSSSCDLCRCKVWSCYVQQFGRRCIYKKIQYLTLTLGSRSYKMFLSTLYITGKFWSCYVQ